MNSLILYKSFTDKELKKINKIRKKRPKKKSKIKVEELVNTVLYQSLTGKNN